MRRTLLVVTLLSSCVACGDMSIINLQDEERAPFFVGQAVSAKPVNDKPPHRYHTVPVSGMHSDLGNTDVDNFDAPLGVNAKMKTHFRSPCVVFTFDVSGRMTAGCVSYRGRGSIVAMDPESMREMGRFTLEGEDNLIVSSMVINDSGRVLIASQQHQLFEVERLDDDEEVQWQVARHADLSSEVGSDQLVIGTLPDGDGNAWFVTGGIANTPFAIKVDYTTVGYVSPSGEVRTIDIADEIVENAPASDLDDVFIVTSKALYSFSVGANGEIVTRWREAYDAGSSAKPGAFSRGSGSAVTLLGDRYLTITDNADDRINVLVYRKGGEADGRLVCKVPVFEEGASATDASPVGFEHADGRFSVVVVNRYDMPGFHVSLDINGEHNDRSMMAAGMTRVDVREDGSGCEVVWSSPVRSTTVPKLSTRTGLIYTYTQDVEAARDGVYVWYITAIDFATGEEAFRVRTGAGGLFNNNFLTLSLSPHGTLYQGVVGGVVALSDG